MPLISDGDYQYEYTVMPVPQMPEKTFNLGLVAKPPVKIATPQYVKPRGSFAEAVAEQTEVTQELLEPASSRNATDGITRI